MAGMACGLRSAGPDPNSIRQHGLPPRRNDMLKGKTAPATGSTSCYVGHVDPECTFQKACPPAHGGVHPADLTGFEALLRAEYPHCPQRPDERIRHVDEDSPGPDGFDRLDRRRL